MAYCRVNANTYFQRIVYPTVLNYMYYAVIVAIYSTTWICPARIRLCLSNITLHMWHIFLTIWMLIEPTCGEPATDFILKRSMASRAWGYYLVIVGIAHFSFSPLLLLGNIPFLEEDDLFFMGVFSRFGFVTNGDFRKRIHRLFQKRSISLRQRLSASWREMSQSLSRRVYLADLVWQLSPHEVE